MPPQEHLGQGPGKKQNPATPSYIRGTVFDEALTSWRLTLVLASVSGFPVTAQLSASQELKGQSYMLRHSTSGKKPTWGVRLTGGSFCTNLKTLISFLPSQFFLKLRKAMVQSTCTCVPAADQCGLSMKLHPLSSKHTQFLLPLRNSTGICIVTWCKPAPGWPLPCTGSA